MPSVATVVQDARHALRIWRAQPGLVTVAVVSLAFGIGLNSTVFAVVDTLLFRPPPIVAPSSWASLFTTATHEPFSTTSYPDLEDLREGSRAFDTLVGHSMMFAAVNIGGQTRLALGELVTANYFSDLGIRLDAGRGFRPSEETGEGAHPVVIISHRLWRERFGGRADALGRTIVVRNRPFEIIGVTPASFTGLTPGIAAELWIPVSMAGDVEPAGINDVTRSATGDTRLTRRGTRWLFVKGRLRSGVTVAQADADTNRLMTALADAHPISNRDRRARVVPMSDVRFHPMIDRVMRPAGAVMMAAVGLVLLVACANLAGLLLVRGAARRREMAVRSALGASRRRLLRQLIVESLVLAGAGGALGFLASRWAASLILSARLPIDIPIALTFATDARVMLFTGGLSLVAAILFGAGPAWRASHPALVPALRDDGGLGAVGGRIGARQMLVTAQVAVSVVLMVTGLLLARSFRSALGMDPGFAADRLVVATVALEMHGYTEAQAAPWFQAAEARLQRIPGVTGVAQAERIPFSPNVQTTQVAIDGRPDGTPAGGVSVDAAVVSASYFDVMGVPIVDGRAFDSRDTPETARVAVVSEALARRFFPGARAVGRRLRLGDQAGPVVEIVGVSRDYTQRALGEVPRAVLHQARSQRFGPSATWLVRGTGPIDATSRAVEAELRRLEPNLVFIEQGPLARLIAASLLPVTLGAASLGALAALALFLSSLGLYGVLAFSVARRTREIGIRLALGAPRARVVRGVAGEALVMVGAGACVGLTLSAAGAQALASVLYGISSLDPIAYTVAAAIVLLVAGLSSVIPARRATAVDPVVALRSL
jgi:predicted permease